MTRSLGLQSILSDFGCSPKLVIRSDATAAIGICKREGLGRVRHLATADLWVQQLARKKGVLLEKWPTTTNPSDLLTKGMARPRIQTLLQILRCQAQGGRAQSAPIREHTCPIYGPIPFEELPDSDIEV